MTDHDCIFCRIIRGNAPATFIYKDNTVVVFLDINPVTPGHMLVVPRGHLPALSDIDDPTGAHVFNIAKRMATALRESGLRCDGINLFLADGEAAFQEVFHAHLHVFPRYEGDGFRLVADRGTRQARSELEATSDLIRSALETMTDKE